MNSCKSKSFTRHNLCTSHDQVSPVNLHFILKFFFFVLKTLSGNLVCLFLFHKCHCTGGCRCDPNSKICDKCDGVSTHGLSCQNDAEVKKKCINLYQLKKIKKTQFIHFLGVKSVMAALMSA